MWQLELKHCPQREQQDRDVLGRVRHVVRVAEIDSCQLETLSFTCLQRWETHPKQVVFGESLDDIFQALVIRAELDLSWKIEDDPRLTIELCQLLEQPIHVCFKILHAVQHRTIGTESKLVHHILECDERRDGDGARIRQALVCWIQVYNRNRP